jgi:hypothetical protein
MKLSKFFLALALILMVISMFFINRLLLFLGDFFLNAFAAVVITLFAGFVVSAGVNRLPVATLKEITRIEDTVKIILIVLNISAWFLGGLAMFIFSDIFKISEEIIRPVAVCVVMNALFLTCAYGYYKWLKEERLEGIVWNCV